MSADVTYIEHIRAFLDHVKRQGPEFARKLQHSFADTIREAGLHLDPDVVTTLQSWDWSLLSERLAASSAATGNEQLLDWGFAPAVHEYGVRLNFTLKAGQQEAALLQWGQNAKAIATSQAPANFVRFWLLREVPDGSNLVKYRCATAWKQRTDAEAFLNSAAYATLRSQLESLIDQRPEPKVFEVIWEELPSTGSPDPKEAATALLRFQEWQVDPSDNLLAFAQTLFDHHKQVIKCTDFLRAIVGSFLADPRHCFVSFEYRHEGGPAGCQLNPAPLGNVGPDTKLLSTSQAEVILMIPL